MKLSDTLMVLLFPFLDVLPFTLPRYWLFRDTLRIPFRYIVLLQVCLASAYSALFYLVNLAGYETAAQWTTIIRYFFLLVFLALAFLLIKASIPKLLFTWLLFVAWQFFVMGNANYLESRFFPDLSAPHPYLVYNITRIVIYLVTCPFLLRFFYRTVADALRINDRAMWRYFWVIPLFSTLFGMLYCTTDDVYAYASWQFLASRYLMLFGACYVSYVALKVLKISHSRTLLEEALKYADRNLLAQKKQYDGLAAHMDELRKARHDLRQHLAVVKSYIDRDDKAGLAEYIEIYKSELPPDTLELYCRNDVVNAVVCYYAAQARDSKIRFDAKVDYPDGCPVSATDITVLLGNLLENAVEAVKRGNGTQKYIKLRVKRHGNAALLILVDNPCLTPVHFNGVIPLSSKREGAGIGVESVCEIAARYTGEAKFEQRDGVFYASVYLSYAGDSI
ncbi:GHKL domain-containing protein [Intestinibacillus massiliensis]|nr:GHKL domain-containing protein [Intestinibacillus massiliensis]